MSFVSALLGLDASHNAGVAQQKADAYGQQAATAYGNIQQQGQQQTSVYNNNYLSLLNKFGSVAGVGAGINAPVQSGSTAQNFSNQNQLLSGNAPAGDQGSNPYQLDQYQQQQLNQTTASIARQAQGAAASYAQQLANRGITDPRALQVGQEQIQEHFAALHAEAETQFYEQVKQDKLKALQALIGEVGNYGAQGISEQEAAAGGYGSLAGAQQNQSNIQQQNAQTQQAGLLHLLTQFAPGGALNHLGGSDPNAIQSDA